MHAIREFLERIACIVHEEHLRGSGEDAVCTHAHLWAVAMGGGERGRREADGEPLALGGRSRVSASELLLPMLCMSAFFSSFPLSLMMRS